VSPNYTERTVFVCSKFSAKKIAICKEFVLLKVVRKVLNHGFFFVSEI